MLLVPGVSAAVEKVAVPLLSVAVSRMLPLLWSVKVTEPVGVPLAALTLAVNVTHESRVIDTADEVSIVVVVTRACGDADAALAAGGAAMPTAAARVKPIKQWPAKRIAAHLSDHGGNGKQRHHSGQSERLNRIAAGGKWPSIPDADFPSGQCPTSRAVTLAAAGACRR